MRSSVSVDDLTKKNKCAKLRAMLYSYAYRLYPNRLQIEALARLLELHRELYNAALE